MDDKKAKWRAYYDAEQRLYGILRHETILYRHGEIATTADDGKLLIPRYPHAIIHVERDAVAEVVALIGQMEAIFTDLTGKHRRKHPRYIGGPVESIQITHHQAHSSQTITADTEAVVIGTAARPRAQQVAAELAGRGLVVAVTLPEDEEAAATVTTTGANLLAYAGAPSLRHRVATGPNIVAFLRRPGQAAEKIAVGLIVLDSNPAQFRCPEEHGRKKRSDTIYDDDHDPQTVKLPTVAHFTPTAARFYIPLLE